MGPTQRMQFGDINQFAHRSVGFRGIELNRTRKADGIDHEFGELANSQFLTGSYVDVAIANLAKGRDSSSTTCRMIAINSAIGGGSIMDRRISFDSDP